MLLREAQAICVGVLLHAWGQAEQLIDIAADQGKIFDLHIGHGTAKGRIASIDEGNVTGNVDRLSRRAILERKVERGILHDGEDNTGALQRLEPRGRNGDLVRAGREKLFTIRALPLRRRSTSEIRLGLSQSDRRVGYGGTCGIGDRAKQRGSAELCLATTTQRH